ncbi:RNA polymerase subunit sigma [Bordetella genomosp. 1]|uniref:RNA polymerase subunit sigma n=1 Tax=Bordetella genomosp. 1 TaxID=1395607 RepID=A0A261S7I3_9BORD|nr:RNA polymerase sigma factor [Bordetella genomosp. 1]OZI33071.1 RNA polymerase subunit sigma [Bordetella genomosp. 1]OZI57175.1 RNA polymerase subunit sigma [Bordetella genomosp. 1]
MAAPLESIATSSEVPAQPRCGDQAWSAAEDDKLLRDLVREHSGRLQRFIVKHIGNTSDAEDLAQQAFLEAARSYRSFRGESQLSTWLYGIALNLVRNHLSRSPQRRYDFTSDDALEQHASATPTPEQAAEQNQNMRLLQEALAELPPNMRDVLLMVGMDDVSYEEAAVLLTVPVGTVRSRLSRARSSLREKLAQKGLHLDN